MSVKKNSNYFLNNFNPGLWDLLKYKKMENIHWQIFHSKKSGNEQTRSSPKTRNVSPIWCAIHCHITEAGLLHICICNLARPFSLAGFLTAPNVNHSIKIIRKLLRSIFHRICMHQRCQHCYACYTCVARNSKSPQYLLEHERDQIYFFTLLQNLRRSCFQHQRLTSPSQKTTTIENPPTYLNSQLGRKSAWPKLSRRAAPRAHLPSARQCHNTAADAAQESTPLVGSPAVRLQSSAAACLLVVTQPAYNEPIGQTPRRRRRWRRRCMLREVATRGERWEVKGEMWEWRWEVDEE